MNNRADVNNQKVTLTKEAKLTKTLIQYLQKMIVAWQPSGTLTSLKEDIANFLKNFTAEIDKTTDFIEEERIIAFRETLAILILKMQLAESRLKLNKGKDFVGCDVSGFTTESYELIITKERETENQIYWLLFLIMLKAFSPPLTVKSNQLTTDSFHYNNKTDLSDEHSEIKNVSLKKMVFQPKIGKEVDDFGMRPEEVKLAKLALKNIVDYFDFFITAFNVDDPEPFQTWAKENIEAFPNLKLYSDCLHDAFYIDTLDSEEFKDSTEEGATLRLQEFFQGLHEAADSNNENIILFSCLNLTNLKKNFSESVCNVLIGLTPMIDDVVKKWRKDRDKQFEQDFNAIRSTIYKHFTFYSALFNSDFSQTEIISKLWATPNGYAVLEPLFEVFHGTEDEVPFEVTREVFHQYNNQKKQELFDAFKKTFESKDDQPLMDALYLGKGKFKYLNHKLIKALALFETDSGKDLIENFNKMALSAKSPKTESFYSSFPQTLFSDDTSKSELDVVKKKEIGSLVCP